MHRGARYPTIVDNRRNAFGKVAQSFVVTLDDGRIYVEPLNRRLTKAEVAHLLKTNEDGVGYLAKKGSLKPLGHPEKNKQKLFAANEILVQMQDSRWLGKVTDLLYDFAESRNASRTNRRRRQGKESPLS